ncbi:exported hypothetical protein [uncultured Eubacteriales bacterium]|uniref:Uncharacterized protein n=1 Tax=uncultured Eubacteriales bacterium TaxID=172733 RepID=A0A212JTP5_9FIRM|nr:exported hypothetical protein [uncultured Eubacteriales bacterium]
MTGITISILTIVIGTVTGIGTGMIVSVAAEIAATGAATDAASKYCESIIMPPLGIASWGRLSYFCWD